MITSIYLLSCALTLGQATDRTEWQLSPQLAPGLELTYTGECLEESLIPNVQHQRLYRFETHVLVLAVTHTPPRDRLDAVPFPEAEKRRLGLDDIPTWIVATEANSFVWPGPDVRPVPGRSTGTWTYGQISSALLQLVARAYLGNRERQRARLVVRSS